jgi:hypothetical protein
MVQRRRKVRDRSVGVILRDGRGAFFAIPASSLSRYRVPDDLVGALLAFLAGDEAGGDELGSHSRPDPVGTPPPSKDRGRETTERIITDFQASRGGHLSVGAATWLLH